MNVAGKSDVGELVGRGQELERLLALLDDARSGRGRAALVLGEAGIGKTRLAEAFAASAIRAGRSISPTWSCAMTARLDA
jgi:MoxR-like ATPase